MVVVVVVVAVEVVALIVVLPGDSILARLCGDGMLEFVSFNGCLGFANEGISSLGYSHSHALPLSTFLFDFD